MIWYELGLGFWLFTYIFFAIDFLFPKKNKKKLPTLCTIFFFSLCYMIVTFYMSPLISFVFYIFLTSLFIFLEFRESYHILFRLIISLYLIRFVFEVLFKVVLYLLQISFPSPSLMLFFTSILSFIFIVTFNEKIRESIANPKFLRKPRKLDWFIRNNLGLLLIIFIRFTHYNFQLERLSIINFFLFFIGCNLFFLLFQEKEKNDNLYKNYHKIIEYSTFTEGLMTEYKSFMHEYKNKLITIKGLASSSNKKLNQYIDSLLEEKNVYVNHYRWLSELKNIPISGVKGLINFKLLQMKELGIEVEVYISEDISKLNENFLTISEKNDLNTLLGIILDNAIEASLESKDKMVSLHLYKDKDRIIILLANTFKHIQIDRLEEKGFSTKGKNRGLGLYMYHNIIKQNEAFSKETCVYDNFFIQKIFIKKCK